VRKSLLVSTLGVLGLLGFLGGLGERTGVDSADISLLYHKDFLSFRHPIRPVATKPLDPDPALAIKKARRRTRIFKRLPRKDCGACGAPDCLTFADDVVRGRAVPEDCLFLKKEAR